MFNYTIPVGTRAGIATAEEMNNNARGYVRWRDYTTQRELTFTEFVHFSGSEYVFCEGGWIIFVGRGQIQEG